MDGDKELAAKVTPDVPALWQAHAARRRLPKTLTRDNVELVTGPIQKITETGMVDENGVEHQADIICLATGFKAQCPLYPIEVVGTNGSIRDHWGEDDPRAHLGITVPDFPNLFMIYGPNTNLGHGGSALFHSECQIRYIMQALREMVEGDVDVLEVKREPFEDYNRKLDAEFEGMVWMHPGRDQLVQERQGPRRHQFALGAVRLSQADGRVRPAGIQTDQGKSGSRLSRQGEAMMAGNTAEALEKVPFRIANPELIPAERYYDPEFFELEKKHLWPHVWQMACRLEEIPEVGDYTVYDIFDKSVIMIHTSEGVKGFLNACRHRGVKLAHGPGKCGAEGFVCPFHGWRWNAEGENTFVFGKRIFSEEIIAARRSTSRRCAPNTGRAAPSSTSTTMRPRCAKAWARWPSAWTRAMPTSSRWTGGAARCCRPTGSSRWKPSWKATT